MKKLYILMLALLCLTVATCKKDVEPYVFNADIKVTDIKTNMAVIEAINEEEGFDRLEAVVLCSADEKVKEPKQYKMTYEDEAFKANVDELLQDTKYYYKIIFTGKYNSVETEVSSFETEKIVMPVVKTVAVTEVTATRAVCGGNVTSDGGGTITARGVCWSISKMPTIEDNKTTNGSGIGSFTSNLSNLSSQTTYYVRAYATNEAGTVYGEEKSFTTLEIVLPTVTTTEVTNITSNSATCGGNVTSDGNGTVTACGICWSTSPNPTIDDNKTTDGSGTGSFTSSLSNLASQTTYYVRAYATNEKGTGYGEQKSFTTRKVFEETVDTDGNSIMTLNGNVIFKMIAVEGGTFKMGAQSSDSGGDNYDSDAKDDESPVHDVTLSSYYIGETEVTQELWEAVMGSNPSDFSGYPQRPVEEVSWNDCQEFIKKLNKITGKNFRLPTEAEWEYAARGGNKSKGYKYSGSNTIGNVAWYSNNSSSRTHDVKTKQANELGIYDMSGNVNEWCHDWYGSYSSGSQTNPTGPSSGSVRILRGGNWRNDSWYCRVSYHRGSNYPDNGLKGNGFRLILQ